MYQQEETTKQKVDRLLKVFGNQLDRDVLESVLEICEGKVDGAIQFLELQGNQPENYYNPIQNNDGIPKDYMDKPKNWIDPKELNLVKKEKIDEEIFYFKNFFLQDHTFEEHLNQQKDRYLLYTSVLIVLLDIGVDFSHGTKSKVLASAWARRDYQLSNYLLGLKIFLLPEVLRALKILDTPRKIRQIENKIKKIPNYQTRNIKKLQNKINELTKECLSTTKCSVNGSLIKRVKEWIKKIPKNQLEFYALQMPSDPWRELADICHLSPKDFSLDYFLKFSFGDSAPKDSIVQVCSDKNNFIDPIEVVKKYQIPYSYLRKNIVNISKETKIEIVKYETIETLIWWYEELISSGGMKEIDSIISKRLEKEKPDLPYGKLMERMLYFYNNKSSLYDKIIPIAEERLKEISLELEQPVVVLGDASFSMDVSIRTATIISSVVSALVEADLKFFNIKSYSPDIQPKTALDVLKVTSNTKAEGLTAPACCIEEYYKKKKIVKLFIMITDEIENEKFNNTYFAQLFYQYYTSVYPSKLVMVSFLDHNSKGRMVKALESFGIYPIEFHFDQKRPDLTRLDKLLGILCSETNFFSKKTKLVSELLKDKKSIQESLKVKIEKEKIFEKDIYQEEKKSEPKIIEIKNDNIEDYKKCIVCMERDKDICLGCGHLYCAECIDLISKKDNQCPTCRKDITSKIKVFL